jgi:hypothetical protein
MRERQMIETIRLRVEDESEQNYYRTVWFLAGALRAVGAADQVIPALQELFSRALGEQPRNRRTVDAADPT